MRGVRFVGLTLVVVTLLGCRGSTAPDGAVAVLGGDWISLDGCKVGAVSRSIRERSGLWRDGPGVETFTLQLVAYDGGVAVALPPRLPACEVTNLVGWLADPCPSATAWYTSPGTGERYCLRRERTNPAGDTLIGAVRGGGPVRVFLPEGRLSPMSKGPGCGIEPMLAIDLPKVRAVELLAATGDDFGNPEFVVTDPIDARF